MQFSSVPCTILHGSLVVQVLNKSFDADELSQLEDLQTTRITRILTNDFPQYFAIVTRIRQEVHAVGPDGGMIVSTVVPQVKIDKC